MTFVHDVAVARARVLEHINIDVPVLLYSEFIYFYFVQCHCPLVQINPKNFFFLEKIKVKPKVPETGELKKRMKKMVGIYICSDFYARLERKILNLPLCSRVNSSSNLLLIWVLKKMRKRCAISSLDRSCNRKMCLIRFFLSSACTTQIPFHVKCKLRAHFTIAIVHGE